MEIVEMSLDEYGSRCSDEIPVFCRADFLKLNQYKMDKVRIIAGKEKKWRLALAFGEKDSSWLAPYSAPFALPIELSHPCEISHYWDYFEGVTAYAKNEGIKVISVCLPPDIYTLESNAKCTNALIGNGFKLLYQELNYSMSTVGFDAELYKSNIQHNARKNLNISLKSGLSFHKCENENEKKEAYSVIKTNREIKGYYLAMSEDQVLSTIKILNHDFFLVKIRDKAIAAAIVFHITKSAVQVVYWGDIPNVGEYKPINYLSFQLLNYYSLIGIETVDIGPSCPGGIPNYGLCSFKEGIGCRISSKLRFEWRNKDL